MEIAKAKYFVCWDALKNTLYKSKKLQTLFDEVELARDYIGLRDDTDKNQWLTDGKIWGKFDEDSFLHPIQIINYLQSKGHKASIEEIIEHFNSKDIC